MFRLQRHYVTATLDGVDTDPFRVSIEPAAKTIAYVYRLPYTGPSDCSRALAVRIHSANRFVQATFKAGGKHVTVVNAADKRAPLVFDGFMDDADDSKTKLYTVRHMNALIDYHGLSARQMARAMESASRMTIYLNEAIITKSDRWYSKFLVGSACPQYDPDVLDAAERELHEAVFGERNDCIEDKTVVRNESSCNATHWAPVDCRTGPRLAKIDLVFMFELKNE